MSAVKDLMQTEEQYETLKNRIRVLKLNEQKNLKRMMVHEDKMEKIQEVRAQTQSMHEQVPVPLRS